MNKQPPAKCELAGGCLNTAKRYDGQQGVLRFVKALKNFRSE